MTKEERIVAVQSEFVDDPASRGYGLTLSDVSFNAGLVRELSASNVPRGKISGQEIRDAIDWPEYIAARERIAPGPNPDEYVVSDAQHEFVMVLIDAQGIDVRAGTYTAAVQSIFPAGSANLAALAALRNVNGSRWRVLFGAEPRQIARVNEVCRIALERIAAG